MSAQFTTTEHFDVSREQVFDKLTDLDTAKNWMRGFVGIEKIKGDRIETGAVWRESRKMFGRTATEVFEAIQVIPGKEIKLRVDGTKGTSKKGEYLFHFILQENGKGTDVTLNGAIGGLKGFAALMSKLFIGSMKKACAKDLQSLKNYMASQTKT